MQKAAVTIPTLWELNASRRRAAFSSDLFSPGNFSDTPTIPNSPESLTQAHGVFQGTREQRNA